MLKFKQYIEETKSKNDPCWDGYQQIGSKKKNGKEVPNCVPEETVNEGKLVKNMRVQHIHNGNKGTVVKGGDKAGGRVEVEWEDGTTTIAAGKYLKSIKEDNDLEEYEIVEESEAKGKTLNKPFRTPDGPKKFSVYVKNDKGNVVKVNFGDPDMEIKRDDPERRKAFRARHGCDVDPGPKWKAKYWSCWQWRSNAKVQD